MILLNKTFKNREAEHVDIEDRGYQFGDGVYEVIRVYEGRLYAMEEHMERLDRSCREIQMSLPYSLEEITNNIKALVTKNELSTGIVYLQITRGAAPRVHQFPDHAQSILTAYTKPMDRPHQLLASGIDVVTLEDIRWLRCDIKSLNLLGNVMAKQEAKTKQCQEAVFIRDGQVTEGSSSNVFVVKDNQVITHPATNLILNGITRVKVLEWLKDKGIEVIESAPTPEQLTTADEMFITSTTMEVMPVISLDGTTIGSGQPGPITQSLQQAIVEDFDTKEV
ncbi:D-amino-acid transaminase [Tuberibacillus sp. Marseille-P3662]|uniref:D-amino-acid transaminase n=1 Tax=Tuberibacillus sp. Marseille-P3662 TaxID=1965358 RepID=UPI000A1CA2C0|nr:D-amino-acid transaminase [Tuberibacillus sp. Marseille-P3662]